MFKVLFSRMNRISTPAHSWTHLANTNIRSLQSLFSLLCLDVEKLCANHGLLQTLLHKQLCDLTYSALCIGELNQTGCFILRFRDSKRWGDKILNSVSIPNVIVDYVSLTKGNWEWELSWARGVKESKTAHGEISTWIDKLTLATTMATRELYIRFTNGFER